MPIKFHCPSCSAAIKAPDTHAGETLPCPKCGQPVVVPAATSAAPVPTVAESSVPLPPSFPQTNEPEPVGEMPEIVTYDSRTAAAPPVTLGPATPDAFAPPQTRSERVIDAEVENIRIVDLHLPFKSVMKFALQFFLCNLLLGAALSVLFLIFGTLLALVGIGLGM